MADVETGRGSRVGDADCRQRTGTASASSYHGNANGNSGEFVVDITGDRSCPWSNSGRNRPVIRHASDYNKWGRVFQRRSVARLGLNHLGLRLKWAPVCPLSAFDLEVEPHLACFLLFEYYIFHASLSCKFMRNLFRSFFIDCEGYD